MSGLALQSLPSCAGDAKRLAALLGLPLQEIALHRFPDGEIRVTVGRAAATTIIYATLDQPNDKLIAILFAAEACGGPAPRGSCCWRPISATCARTPPLARAKRSAREWSAESIAATVDRVITVDAHLHRTADIGAVFPGIEADNLSAMPAIANRSVRPASIPRRSWLGRTRSPDPG